MVPSPQDARILSDLLLDAFEGAEFRVDKVRHSKDDVQTFNCWSEHLKCEPKPFAISLNPRQRDWTLKSHEARSLTFPFALRLRVGASP